MTVSMDLLHWVLIHSVANRKEAEEKIETLASHEYGIIYITEALAAECKSVIEKYQERSLPAIIQIQECQGNTGDGVQGVKNSVEQAVGSDILLVIIRKQVMRGHEQRYN